MASESGIQFIEKQVDLIEKQMQLTSTSQGWFTNEEDITKRSDLYDKFSRTDVIKKLHEVQGKEEYTAAEWVSAKWQANWLAGWERDLRRRYRSRITNIRIDKLQKQRATTVIRQSLDDVSFIANQV